MANKYFSMSRAELERDGSAGAKNEIKRRNKKAVTYSRVSDGDTRGLDAFYENEEAKALAKTLVGRAEAELEKHGTRKKMKSMREMMKNPSKGASRRAKHRTEHRPDYSRFSDDSVKRVMTAISSGDEETDEDELYLIVGALDVLSPGTPHPFGGAYGKHLDRKRPRAARELLAEARQRQKRWHTKKNPLRAKSYPAKGYEVLVWTPPSNKRDIPTDIRDIEKAFEEGFITFGSINLGRHGGSYKVVRTRYPGVRLGRASRLQTRKVKGRHIPRW